MLKRWSSVPYLFWTGIFIVVPLFLVLYYSLTIPYMGSVRMTFGNFARFVDPLFLNALWLSIYLALVSTAFCLILGYPLAVIIARMGEKYEKIAVVFLILPMWMNFLLRTYAWLNILGKNGIVNVVLNAMGIGSVNFLYNDGAVLLGMVYNFLPFMVLPIYTVLKKIDSRVIEAAEDLGANKIQTFLRVIIPLSLPGVSSGILMTFMPAVSTFVISSLLGGGKTTLIGNLVEQQFLLVGNWHFGSAISVVLMAIILLTMGILSVKDKEEDGVKLW